MNAGNGEIENARIENLAELADYKIRVTDWLDEREFCPSEREST